jgi:hypothetical protein
MTSVLSVLLLITLLCVSPSQAIPFGVVANHSSATDVADDSPVDPDFTLVDTGVTWRNGHVPNRTILNILKTTYHLQPQSFQSPIQYSQCRAPGRIPKLSLLNKLLIPNLKPNSKIYLKMSIRNPPNSTRYFALVTHSNLNHRSHSVRRQSSCRHVRTFPSIFK